MQAWLQQCLCMQMTNYRGVVFNGWEMGENRGKRGHERTKGRIAKVCTNACVHLNLQSRVLCIWPLLFYAASAPAGHAVRSHTHLCRRQTQPAQQASPPCFSVKPLSAVFSNNCLRVYYQVEICPGMNYRNSLLDRKSIWVKCMRWILADDAGTETWMKRCSNEEFI